MAGQDAWGPGVVGALAGGLLAANGVLRQRQVGTMWRTILSRQPGRDPAAPWQGYLRVAAIEALSPEVRRIRLEPLTGGSLPFSFAAGQYLKVDLPVAVEAIERSYSICSGPGERGFAEIAVKLEPDGLGSTFLHEELAVGDALRVSGPHGEFTWEPGPSQGALLLVGGGVGITPLMSVLTAAADAGHTGRIVLLAGFRTEAGVLFRPELEALRERLPGLEVSIFVSGEGRRIGAEALRAFAGVGRVHLCGPAAMMQDVIGHLTELGVAREAIRTEAFVSGRSKETRRERAHVIALAAAAAGVTAYKIEMTGGEPAFVVLARAVGPGRGQRRRGRAAAVVRRGGVRHLPGPGAVGSLRDRHPRDVLRRGAVRGVAAGLPDPAHRDLTISR